MKKVLSSSISSRSLEKDIEELKREKKGLKKRKVWSWKLCVIYT